MNPNQLFDQLKAQYQISADSDLACCLGITSARISQIRIKNAPLTVRQLAVFIKKAAENAKCIAFVDAIRPIVEMFPIERHPYTQNAKWEILPTGHSHSKNQSLRTCLESSKGLYILYDSQGCAIYAGKTEHQNIWKEMTSAFNRERTSHQAFFVSHPTTGQAFSPAWETPRQPRKRLVYLYDTAHYFSAYEVAQGLIPKLEALVVRAFCNSLSNKKMETF